MLIIKSLFLGVLKLLFAVAASAMLPALLVCGLCILDPGLFDQPPAVVLVDAYAMLVPLTLALVIPALLVLRWRGWLNWRAVATWGLFIGAWPPLLLVSDPFRALGDPVHLGAVAGLGVLGIVSSLGCLLAWAMVSPRARTA